VLLRTARAARDGRPVKSSEAVRLNKARLPKRLLSGSAAGSKEPPQPRDRQDMAKRLIAVTNKGLVSNCLLVVGKGFAGVSGNSVALVADAAHSLSDLVTDLITVLSIRLGNKQPSEFQISLVCSSSVAHWTVLPQIPSTRVRTPRKSVDYDMGL
jgi:hypothetical protein